VVSEQVRVPGPLPADKEYRYLLKGVLCGPYDRYRRGRGWENIENTVLELKVA